MSRHPATTPSGRVSTAAATLFFLAQTVVHTWPLATAPDTLTRHDNADAQLNAWIVGWIAHALPRQPLRLFDANIFHPEPRALAFSEPLLVPGLMGAPLLWLGASPVLTHNVLLLAGFTLTGLFGFLAARRLTGDAAAGLLAGSLLAFNGHALTRLPHVQAQHAEWLPVALAALDSVLTGTGAAAAIVLGLCVALLALTSGYWVALAVVALGLAILARADDWWGQARATAGRLALAAVVAAAVAVPPLLPYWRAHREQGLVRTLDVTASFTNPASYLVTPGRLHFAAWSHRFLDGGGAYFPGLTALALAAAGAMGGRRWRTPRVRMLLAIALGGFLLSLGPRTPLYAGLYHLFPPMKGLRDPSRFGYLVLLAVALLAAEGLAAWRRRLPARARAAVAAAAVALVHLEALAAPLSYVPFTGFPAPYARLAEIPAPVVLAEFPFHPAAEAHQGARYVLASTVHWHRLVNGYSGFVPAAYARRSEALSHFPDEGALAELHRLGVTHVLVHGSRYRPQRTQRIHALLSGRPDFALLESWPGGERLYALRR